MASKNTIIVQNIPDAEISDVWNPVELLKDIFLEYGLVKCVFLCPATEEIVDGFAHMTFDNSIDALKVYDSHEDKKIQIGREAIRLTLISEDDTPIDSLNDYCLMNIFSILDEEGKLTVEKVSKRWQEIALRSWHNQKMMKIDNTNDQSLEKYLVRCGHYVDYVIFNSYYNTLYQPSLALMREYCKNLKKLDFFKGYIDTTEEEFSDNLAAAFRDLVHLKSLGMSGIGKDFCFDFMDDLPVELDQIRFFQNYDEYARVSISLHLSRFRKLTMLILNGFVINDEALRGLENLENLIHLDLKCSRMHQSNVVKIRNLAKLQFLRIPSSDINDEILFNIVTKNFSLTVLDISYISTLTDRSLMAISQLPKLKTLVMKNLPHVLLHFMDEMPELEHLDCENCSKVDDEGLCKLVLSSPKLKYLNVLSCKNTTELLVVANAAAKSRVNGIMLKIRTDVWAPFDEEEQSSLIEIYTPPPPDDYYTSRDFDFNDFGDDD